MTPLIGEHVLLVSNQPWEGLRTSKHHYAVELVRRGCKVYFIGPPDRSSQVTIEALPEAQNLYLVRHGLSFPFSNQLRFHARPIFDWFMRRHVSALVSILPTIDTVWCFEPNIYSNLRWFGARRAVFHPVDPVPYPYQVALGHTADIIFSVSERILSVFAGGRVSAHVIGHGLAAPFVEQALHRSRTERHPGPVRIGYIGNLGAHEINWLVLHNMIEEHPDAEFHFWGPYPLSRTDWEGAEAIQLPNVRLHGTLPTDRLARAIQQVDVFVLAYRTTLSYDKSNSHKILEYLSTGKVVVSSRIDAYFNRPDLVIMAERADESDLPGLLTRVITDLSFFNAPNCMSHRVEYALSQTYDQQVQLVASHLADLSLAR